MTRILWTTRKKAATTIAAIVAAAVPVLIGPGAQAGESIEGSPGSVLEGLYGHDRWQGRLLWLDLAANRTSLDTPNEVRAIMRRTADVGFESVVVDVKNYTGFVAYQSAVAPHLSTTDIPIYQPYPEGYDLLETVVQEGHAVGLDVIASVNVFSEGTNTYQDGPAYDNPEWQSTYLTTVRTIKVADGATHELGVDVARAADALVAYTPDNYERSPANRWGVEATVVDGTVIELIDRAVTGAPAPAVPAEGYVLSGHGAAAAWMREHLVVGGQATLESGTQFVKAEDYPSASTFVNPILPEVQEYELSVIREIAENYDVDGISLDRARYSNGRADFSQESRDAFEAYLGEAVDSWPSDVMTYELDGFAERRVEGPLYRQWVKWRAHNIQQFFQQARDEIYAIDPSLYFTDYVGAWYPLYYEEGVNWGSRDYQPSYDWADEDYSTTGYAEDLDFLMVGTYFEDVTREDAIASGQVAEWYSVEGSADLATEAVDEATFVYSSLYLLQYQHDPERFRAAMKMALERTHGIMIFDLVYLEQYGWWEIIDEVFDQYPPVEEPHTNAGWQRMLRADS